MNRFLIRLFLVATLLCDFLGLTDGARAQGVALKDKQKSEERFHVAESRGKACLDYAEARKRSDGIQQIKQNDGYLKPVAEEPQSPVEVVFRSAPSSHRIASNRPTRLLPTHGGKPGQHHGRWTAGTLLNPYRFAPLQLCRDLWRTSAASSPRLRYVIALRRLLC